MTTASALYRDCARLFMVGFPGTRIDADFAALMGDGIFGAILFKRNVGSAQETAALCRLPAQALRAGAAAGGPRAVRPP